MRRQSRLGPTLVLRLLPLLASGAALGGLAREAGAQVRSASELACMQTLPASVFTRVPVYLVISERDSGAAKLLHYDAALLAERVAIRTRTLLGARPDSLPAGEPRVDWQSHGGSVMVTVHRSGPVTWRIDTTAVATNADGETLDEYRETGIPEWQRRQRPSTLLLAEAMRAEVAADPPFFVWPADARGDSLRIALRFTHPTIKPTGVVAGSVEERPAFPAFTLAEPWTTDVEELRSGRVEYPGHSSTRGVTGTIILEYAVDTLGMVEMRSVRDSWQSKRPRPQGDRARHYAAFVDAARRSLVKSRHRPALVGGCPIRQIVQKPFTYSIGN